MLRSSWDSLGAPRAVGAAARTVVMTAAGAQWASCTPWTLWRRYQECDVVQGCVDMRSLSQCNNLAGVG